MIIQCCNSFHVLNSSTPEQDSHTPVFTLRSRGATDRSEDPTRANLLSTSSQPPSPHVFTHRLTSACNLRVDKDSMPGVCSRRKTTQISTTPFISPRLGLISVRILVLWCRSGRSRAGLRTEDRRKADSQLWGENVWPSWKSLHLRTNKTTGPQ